MNTGNLVIYQGATFQHAVTITNSDGNPMNLSGYGITGYVKNRFSDSGWLAMIQVSGVSLTGGQITLNIANTGTSGLVTSIMPYDVHATHLTSGTVTKIMGGNAFIYPAVLV
jgi:hypothetical protein